MTGWTEYSLGEVAEAIDYGVTSSAVEEAIGPKFLRITDIQGGRVDWTKVPFCACSSHQVRLARLTPGDIVFARTGATTGKSFLLREVPSDSVFASYLIRVRLGGQVEPRFIAHFFKTDEYWNQIKRGMRGAGQPGVNATTLSELRVPVPSLDEQRRIADVLDLAEKVRDNRRTALAVLAGLPAAVFVDLFGRHEQTPVDVGRRLEDHPEGWRWELLGEVARLATGHTPDRKRESYWNGDIPWVTLTDIRRLDGRIALETTEAVTQAGIDNSSAVLLPTGTVCFSRTASVGFVTIMGRAMATSQDFVNWVCGPRIEPIYLMHALLMSRERLRGLSAGSTHKTIYFPTVEQFRLLLPPLELQRVFAERIRAIDGLKEMHRRSLEQLDALLQSLQELAFRGQL